MTRLYALRFSCCVNSWRKPAPIATPGATKRKGCSWRLPLNRSCNRNRAGVYGDAIKQSPFVRCPAGDRINLQAPFVPMAPHRRMAVSGSSRRSPCLQVDLTRSRPSGPLNSGIEPLLPSPSKYGVRSAAAAERPQGARPSGPLFQPEDAGPITMHICPKNGTAGVVDVRAGKPSCVSGDTRAICRHRQEDSL